MNDARFDGRPGACVWLTGRSGAGKSTATALVVDRLGELGRVVTVLDTVPELAKAAGERSSEPKLMRKAFVAAEIVRHGGIVICVTVSARREVRQRARERVGDGFIEVWFDLPLEIAEQRRRRRGSRRPLRKRLRRGVGRLAKRLSGRHAGGGFESPRDTEVHLDAATASPEEMAGAILQALSARGVVD